MRSAESELGYIRDAFDLMDQMEHLQDEKVVLDKVAILLSNFGFDRFVVARLPQPREKRAIHLLSLSAYGAAERLAGRRGQPVLMRLTSREQDVLSYLANGLTVAQVAEVLRISGTTVLTHLKNAKQKLGTRTMTHTVVEAIRQDQIRP